LRRSSDSVESLSSEPDLSYTALCFHLNLQQQVRNQNTLPTVFYRMSSQQQQQRLPYTAKHAFAGTAQQSQLSFQAGDVVFAVPGQTGAWWWGNW
jgi:hypothetical protein